ncbi:MAG: DoxX family protein [Solirubrobacteraceae bacterium]
MSLAQRLLSVSFIASGSLHFLRPSMYEQIVPDVLPAHRGLVLTSGAAEIAGGVGVAIAATRRSAGWWLIATLVAVFPANVHMAMHPARYPAFAPFVLWARLPFQGVFIWWARRATRP